MRIAVGHVGREAFQATCGNPRSLRISTGAACSTAGARDADVMRTREETRTVSATNQPRPPLARFGMDIRAETALWSDIAYSDVVRVWTTQDSTIGLALDQGHVRVPRREAHAD